MKEENERKANNFEEEFDEEQALAEKLRKHKQQLAEVDEEMEQVYLSKKWFVEFKTMKKDEAFGELAL